MFVACKAMRSNEGRTYIQVKTWQKNWRPAYLQELMDVVSDVIVHQSGIQRFEVCVVHILKHEAWGLGLRVSDHIKQLYDVWASAEVL